MSEPIKIAYLLTPIEFGGAERVNINFLRNVDRDRYHVVPFLLLRPWERENLFTDYLNEIKMAFHEIPVALRDPKDGPDPARVFRAIRKFRGFLVEGNFNLVHTHGYFADIVGISSAALKGKPAISTCHGYITDRFKLSLYRYLDLKMLKLAGRVIAVSEGIRNELVGCGIRGSRIRIIRNAVPVQNEILDLPREGVSSVPEKRFVVGYIGRLSPEKGLPFLIEAVDDLKREGIPLEVLIVGDGPMKDELQASIEKRGLMGTVRLVGFQSDMDTWIAEMDVFILPSLTEGTPMSLLEAMAKGKPPIATSVGGIPDVIRDGVNGLLIATKNPESIKDAIRALWKNEELRFRMGREAHATIREKYSLKSWVDRMCSEYEELMGIKSGIC